MRSIVIAASLLMLAASPALAADDIMAGFYGNTVISTGGAIESRTHYKADHTFDAMFSGMGQTFASKGTWSIDATGQLCRVYDPPPPGFTNPVCIPAEAHKVGDTWTVTVAGAVRNVTLKGGIE